MPTTIYNLYCDESGIDGRKQFHFGGLRCSPARACILKARLEEVRDRHGLASEMKWTRVSRAMLPAYKAFGGVFLNCPYSRFRLHTVNRGLHWRGFGGSEQERFFKAYYVFLRLTMSLACRYSVFVDDKPGKPHRWSNVNFAINRAVYRDHGLHKHVRDLSPQDSRNCDLLQVTDIVLGALTSAATAAPKLELAEFVRQHLARDNRRKLSCREWSPREPVIPQKSGRL